MTPDDLKLNPFEVPMDADGRRVMPPDKWVGNLKEWLWLAWLGEVSGNFLVRVVTKVYRDRGILDGGDDYPSISDILEAVELEDAPRGSDKAREKVIDRLSTIRAMLPGLDCRREKPNVFADELVALDSLGLNQRDENIVTEIKMAGK